METGSTHQSNFRLLHRQVRTQPQLWQIPIFYELRMSMSKTSVEQVVIAFVPVLARDLAGEAGMLVLGTGHRTASLKCSRT